MKVKCTLVVFYSIAKYNFQGQRIAVAFCAHKHRLYALVFKKYIFFLKPVSVGCIQEP